MKKVFAIVALVAAMFVAGNAQAQTTINVGYSPEVIRTYLNNSNDKDVDVLYGFHAGFTTNLKLVQEFGIAGGAQFRMNMKKRSLLGDTATAKDLQILIDVPVLFNYNIKIGNNFAITPFVGPMFSFAVVGKTNTMYFSGSVLQNDEVYNWYGKDSSLRRFNISAVVGGNFRISSFNIYGGYRIGLLNQIKDSDTVKRNASGFFVGVGFTL